MKQFASRFLSAALLAGVLFSASCKNNDDDGVKPRGAAPDWGPSMHTEMIAVIEQLDSFHVPALETLSPQQARAQRSIQDAAKEVARLSGINTPANLADTFGRDIPVTNGTVHVRIYVPKGGSGPQPAIVYYPGGGWVIGSLNTYDASARALAEQVQAIVVAVDYRKGPEFKFPTAHNDAFTAYKWVIENAAALNVDISKLAVAGESAGGNLACNVSIAARNAVIMTPKHQLLIYPVAQNNLNTASYQRYALAKPLYPGLISWFLENYLTNITQSSDPRISLVLADLKGLPATTILNAEIDPLRDDGRQLEVALRAAGVSVTRNVWDGVTHEFFGMNTVLPEARDAQAVATAALRVSLK
jgi:acetyl esterase